MTEEKENVAEELHKAIEALSAAGKLRVAADLLDTRDPGRADLAWAIVERARLSILAERLGVRGV